MAKKITGVGPLRVKSTKIRIITPHGDLVNATPLQIHLSNLLHAQPSPKGEIRIYLGWELPGMASISLDPKLKPHAEILKFPDNQVGDENQK